MSEPSHVDTTRDQPDRHAADLVRRAIRGEPGAFARLYESHVDRVHRFVAYRVGDQMLAADLTQDIFVNALRALPRLGRASRFEPWLMRIARNRVANHWRTVSRRPRQVAIEYENGDEGGDRTEVGASEGVDSQVASQGEHSGHDPLERVEQRVDYAAFQTLIGSLSEAKQDVLALRFGSGCTVKQTAAVLGRSEVAVKKLQARALAELREALR